jgi:very-short-patch-repair endonuclease
MRTQSVYEPGKFLNRWFNRRINRNKNAIIAFTGSTGCLSGDTKLFNETKTLDELYNSGKRFIETYSINKFKNKSGCFYPIRSKSEIIPSGEKEVYEIELENGKKVKATKEHKFFIIKNKNKKIEVTLKELKVGDNFVCYPKDFLIKFYENANEKTKLATRKKFKYKKLCSKCNNLFYINCEIGKSNTKFCNNCKIKTKKHKEDKWFEWEDNLIRNLYYNESKKKILELIPRTWSGIVHRAKRLKIKRNPILQWEQNAWTSKNNPMYNPKFKLKAMTNQQKHIYARNKKTQIEQQVADFLDTQNIKYNFNKVVRTKSSFRFPDFQIGNLIIECDGIYWHNQRNNKKEKERENELKELGFEIIKFTDKEIINNFEEVKKCIIQKLNQ